MAISGSFKQQCPSCEANVLIKDPKFIGKKVDCPKCKYRFVVEDPAVKDKKKVAAGDTVSGKQKDTAIAAKAKATEIDDDLEEVEEEEAGTKARAGGKAAGKRRRDEDDSEDDEGPATKKSKKKKKAAAGNNKMLIGLALGGVGLIVLAVAGLFLAGVFSDPPKTAGKGGQQTGGQKGGQDDPKSKGGGDSKGKGSETDGPTGGQSASVIVENTNFLPTSSESVYQCRFKDFLDSSLGKAAFGPAGTFSDADFVQNLGISALGVDEIVTAESYTDNWTFHVVHTATAVKDMRPLIQALGLTDWGANKTKHKCYEVQPNAAAWVLALARLPLFVPAHTLTAQPMAGKERPLLLHMRDAHTLIFAHAEPMQAYLKAGGNIEPNKANVSAGKKFDANADPSQPEPFMTISPALRDMLSRVQARRDGKVLFSSATHLRPAALRGKSLEDPNRLIFRVRPFWDVVNALQEKSNRLQYVGMAMVMKGPISYTFNNSLTCNTASESTQLQSDLQDNVAWQMVQFFGKAMGHKVDVLYDDPAMPQPDLNPAVKPGQTPVDPKGKPNQPKKEDLNASHIKTTVSDKSVDFALNLILTGSEAINNMKAAVTLMAIGVKAEAESAAGRDFRAQLAEAGEILGEKGLSKRGVPPETFPPGTFERKNTDMWNAREPSQRVSWMAGLLPYLGHDPLFNRIQFDLSWRHGPNWLVARTLVPQFLDPSYPANTRFVAYPGMPLDCAATHYVGIGGVGTDAADVLSGDPAMVGKLGIFGYNRMTPLSTIKDKGRGLANTVLLIRVPHDGPAGVAPWMAGGGRTVRSVPDKNSLAPFVSPGPKGEEGTVVLMADGSVRWLKKGMSDAAFKAICTVDGPAPDGLNLDADSSKLEPAKEEKRTLPKEPVPVGPGTGKPATAVAKVETQTLPAGWQQFTHKEGGFTIAMPTGATPAVEAVPGNEVHGYKHINQPTNTTYWAGFFKLSPNELQAAKNNPELGLGELKKSQEMASGVQLTNETKITLGKYAGREFMHDVQAGSGKASVYTRIYLVNDKAYVLTLTSPTINQSSPEFLGFFNSFKLSNVN